MESTTAPRIRGGIPGRYFAVVFGSLLGVLLLIGVPVVLRFGSNQDRLEDLRRSWPAAAAKVNEFYTVVDDELSRTPSLMETSSADLWKEKRQAFKKSPNREEQIESVMELERLAQEMLPKLSESTQKSRADAIGSTEVKQYLEIESGLAKAESDSIGKLVCFLLRIRPSVVVGENWRDAP